MKEFKPAWDYTPGLPPVPVSQDRYDAVCAERKRLSEENEKYQQACDVMMRRGWAALPRFPNNGWDRWIVTGNGVSALAERTLTWPDPFTALIEADRMFVEMEERKRASH